MPEFIQQRGLYLVGRARVHLDRLERLGEFLELEVLLTQYAAATDGIRETEQLLQQLGINRAALIDRAYVDLLEAGYD